MPIEHVSVAEEEIHPATAFVVMPVIMRVVHAPIRMPGPVAADKLGDRSQSDFGRFNGRRRSGVEYITRHMFGARKIPCPFDEVAVAPAIPTGFGHRVQAIATVGGTMEESQIRGINIERPVRRPLVTAIRAGKTSQVGRGWPLATESGPAIMIRIAVPVVLCVHRKGEPDLMFVAVTLGLEPLGLARDKAGSNMAARIAMIAITTSNSIRVKPDSKRQRTVLEGATPDFTSTNEKMQRLGRLRSAARQFTRMR